jgi:DNA-binding NarL/FixJ family response regulator
MTTALNEALRKISALPKERQDDAAQILLALIEHDARPYRLSQAQLDELDLAIAEADAGDLASDQEVREALHKPWA